MNAFLRSIGLADYATPIGEALGGAAKAVEDNDQLPDAMTKKVDQSKEAMDTAIADNDFAASGTMVIDNAASGVEDTGTLSEALIAEIQADKKTTDQQIESELFQESGKQIIDDTAEGEETIAPPKMQCRTRSRPRIRRPLAKSRQWDSTRWAGISPTASPRVSWTAPTP